MGATAGIIRVSTRAQAQESDSPANQRAVLEAQGATLFYEDVGSGFSLQRRRSSPGWQQLIGDLEAGRISRLLATDISRAARRDALLSELIDLCDQRGVEFLAAGMSFSHRSAHQWYSAKQLGLVAELYSRDLSDRIRRGQQAALSRGIVAMSSRTLPFHLMREPGTRHGVVPNPDRWDIARKGVMAYIEGRISMDGLAARFMELLGVMSEQSTVHNWLRSPALEGHYGKRDGTIHLANAFPALISPEEGQLLRKRMAMRRKVRASATEHGVNALTGLMACSLCGRAATHAGCVKKGKRYSYLRCRKRDCPAFGRYSSAHLIEMALLSRLDQALLARRAATVKGVRVESPEMVELRRRISTMEGLLAQVESPGVRADLEQARLRLEVLERALGGGEADRVDAVIEVLLSGENVWLAQPPCKRNVSLLGVVERATVDLTYKPQGGGWEEKLVTAVVLR